MNTYHLFVSSFLSLELMPLANLQFINETFKHLNDLEKEELHSWESIPESERFFRKKPIGNKPYKTKELSITEQQIVDILSSNGLRKFTDIIVKKDQTDSLKDIEISIGFGNSNYGVFYTAKNQIIEHIWLDLEELKTSDISEVTNILITIGKTYQMVLVDWYEQKIINLTQPLEVETFLNLNLN